MQFFKHLINSTVRSLMRLPPSVAYYALIPSVILLLIQQQHRHCNYVDKHTLSDEYDYIVIGAGSGGSVMASRLSEDSHHSVLVLEAGLAENIVSDVPRLALLLQGTPIDWSFVTEPQSKSCFGLKGRQMAWPRGRVMGGSSVLNTMVYSRGNSRDYDQWAATGAPGWSWADLFPYFIKAEDNRDPSLVATGYHGQGGPLTVTNATYATKISKAFVRSGPFFGYPIGSTTGARQSVFDFPQRTIRNGKRLSMARAYLEPVANQRDNLHIFIRSFVTRILFNADKRASGVEFVRNGRKMVVRARREVILSAGAVMSPKILMLSGIGHRQHLNQLGIDCISDRPVGDNLMDHVASSITFSLNESVGYDFIGEIAPSNILEYLVDKNNSLSSTILESMAFVNSKYADPLDDWPDIQLHVLPASVASDHGLRLRKVMRLTGKLWSVYKPYEWVPTLTIYPTLLRPKSRGTIRLLTANPWDRPVIDPNFFANDSDLDVLVDGMRLALDVVSRSPPLQRYDARPIRSVFPGCERYQLYSDSYLRCMCQTFTAVIYHPMGTCKMADPTSDPTGSAVVDTELRVIGVNGLRVVDASIFPGPVSGNINAPIVAVAEKIADHIRGRRLRPMRPPMTAEMIARLPNLPFDKL
ncbi:glucose dehydrogenase [FAD, quinone]-like [Oppia nitens]|uniref:glucose dehydrogenase [FAD, quinone]-like n=1 Tax=Oppia nitens TaxID=1686743 RepID=UPI0023DA98CD|nr:glucose dehydrogenase [FAD, quinone]-like [Oppia nitens]